MTVLPRFFQPIAKQIKNENSAIPTFRPTRGENPPFSGRKTSGSSGKARYNKSNQKMWFQRAGQPFYARIYSFPEEMERRLFLHFRLSLLVKKIISLQRFLQRGCYLNLNNNDLRRLNGGCPAG
jgi:hypothetical protein